ncbi:hypothetical protein CCUS01_06757 [Colletotrichum cuscutae]|uniref:Uncharacterized protein n=1 Tax=Colletotrichum cuscutae TaxID=1209917 RepID=A0AAI9V5H3_9PEZI|nr:hypothetical protein CCUS01_06757 [Colletotrichum cuscutae]
MLYTLPPFSPRAPSCEVFLPQRSLFSLPICTIALASIGQVLFRLFSPLPAFRFRFCFSGTESRFGCDANMQLKLPDVVSLEG